jgi:zinc protease
MQRRIERIYIERDKTDSANQVGEFIRNFLEQESIPGIENEYRYTLEMVPGITREEVNRYARETIPLDSPKLVVYMGATNSELPTPSSAQLLAEFGAAEKIAVTELDEKALATSLMAKPPAAGSIVGETVDKRLGLTTLTLSNGIKVILKPTDFRNDQVLLGASRFGGQSLFGDADIINARYASAVVAAMGTGDYTPQDLRKILAGKAATISAGLSSYTESLGASSGGSDIETMLQLVYLKLTAARRDPALFQSFVGKQVESTRNAMSQPDAVFQDALVSTLYNNNPRVPRVPRPEDFARLDLDRILAIYKERFASARGMTFIMVGSFDMAKVRPLIATYLASLPTPEIKIGYRDLGIKPVAGVVRKALHSGAEAKSTVSINFTGDAAYSEAEVMRLAAMVDVMNIRIIETLREKLALIYGGGLSGGLSKIPTPRYAITATLPTGPENVDKVVAALFAEIERMKTEGPSQADLNKVRQNWLQRHQKATRENGYWLGALEMANLQGTDPAEMLTYEKRVNALTTDDLKNAARRYFDMKNYVQLVLYPEAK